MTIKEFFAQDKVSVGLVAGLGAELGFCIVLTVVLVAIGLPIESHLRWYGGMFIPLILVLHRYMKRRSQLQVTRTLIVLLFVTFLAYMVYMLKTGTITMQ